MVSAVRGKLFNTDLCVAHWGEPWVSGRWCGLRSLACWLRTALTLCPHLSSPTLTSPSLRRNTMKEETQDTPAWICWNFAEGWDSNLYMTPLVIATQVIILPSPVGAVGTRTQLMEFGQFLQWIREILVMLLGGALWSYLMCCCSFHWWLHTTGPWIMLFYLISFYSNTMRKKVKDSQLGPLLVCSLHILPMSVWVFSRDLCFLPHPKDAHRRWTGVSALPSLSEWVCARACVCVCVW